jgi:tetratricopeptide (TPR) repeat protein
MRMKLEEAPAASFSPASEFGTTPGLFSSTRKRSLVLSLLLALATLAVYNSVIHNAFLNLDDYDYVTHNQHVQSGLTAATLRWALTSYDAENWHPLTWFSHAMDWQLFGKNAGGHHYTSVLFHALNAVLLFLLLQSATGFTGRSLMVAALFALHPVNVESVAWVAERKNVLSMMFFLLALLAYGWYAQRPSVRRYSCVALLFILGLMAKPQIITLPFVLLLWDYWPLERFGFGQSSEVPSRFARASIRRLVLEKVPLLFLSAADAVVTIRAQHTAVHTAMAEYSLHTRVANAMIAYSRYVAHAVWPFRLAPAYPLLDDAIPFAQVLTACAFLLLVTGLALASRKRYLLVGWLWFLGTLVPMIGVVQVGNQSMADRYAYTSFIGLFWMATWVIAETAQEWRISPRWLAVPACLVLVATSVLTVRQVGYWHDSETLWRYTLSVTNRNFMAHTYLAGELTKENRHEEAIAEYTQAEQFHRYPIEQVGSFADYELRHEHLTGAMADARRVLQGTNDRDAREMAFRDLGIANTKLGKTSEARENYKQALQIDPHDTFALMGMGLLAYRDTDFRTAAEFFSRAAAVEPIDFHYLLMATALQKGGRQAEANTAYAQARRVSSDWAEAQKKADWFLSN